MLTYSLPPDWPPFDYDDDDDLARLQREIDALFDAPWNWRIDHIIARAQVYPPMVPPRRAYYHAYYLRRCHDPAYIAATRARAKRYRDRKRAARLAAILEYRDGAPPPMS